MKMPVVFIGHGSPLNILLDNSYTQSLKTLGKNLPVPKAVLVISAHWLTDGTYVGCMERPRMIYDFYGFPRELYEITYPAPGAPAYAELVTKTAKKPAVKCDRTWGLDHASWAVLRHIYPKASIPVFEMSLDYSFNEWHPKPIQYHYDLARQLSELRGKEILIIGSGNIVHNLGMLDFNNIDAKPFGWSVEFDEKVKKNIISRNDEELVNYMAMGKTASLAVPTLDHYLPMIYALALREKNEPVTFTHEGFQYGSISMRCFQIG